MTSADDPVLHARAWILSDLHATGVADPHSVSVLEEAVTSRRWWLSQWQEGGPYIAGLVAQDVQDELLQTRGRWPVCPQCEDATHALYIHPELGGPDPTWVCEETGREVAPLGGLAGVSGAAGPAI
jgi:hypothetical protein